MMVNLECRDFQTMGRDPRASEMWDVSIKKENYKLTLKLCIHENTINILLPKLAM